MKKIKYLTNQTSLYQHHEIDHINDPGVVLKYLDSAKIIGLDVESNGLDPHQHRVLLISLGDMYNQFVIDCTSVNVEFLRPYLESQDIIKVAHNGKFDYKMIYGSFGIRFENLWDTLLAEKLIYNGLPRGLNAGLDALIYRYFGVTVTKSTRDEFVGKSDNKFTVKQIKYSADDIGYLPQLRQFLIEGITNEQGVLAAPGLRFYNLEEVHKLESDVALAWGDIEYNGFYLDAQYWKTNVIPFYRTEKIDILSNLDDLVVKSAKEKGLNKYVPTSVQQTLFGEAVPHFQKTHSKAKIRAAKNMGVTHINWSSPKQVNALLNDLNYDLTYNDTKQGEKKESSGKEVLYQYCSPDVKNKLEGKDYEGARKKATTLVDFILLFKTVNKILSNYGEKLLLEISPITGRVHPVFNSLGADTGRASCKSPNLQNIPATTRFRSGFMGQDGGYLITADYSGAELRLIAEGSEEPAMIDAFNNDEDVHGSMGELAYGVPVSKTENKDLRDRIKNVNFGLAYGATAKSDKILKAFGTEADAQAFLDKYFGAFPKLKEFFDKLRTWTRNSGYSCTFLPYTRIRWYHGHAMYKRIVDSKDRSNPKYGEAAFKLSAFGREGMNHPIQGTSADIMKLAMVNIRKYIKDNNLWSTLRMVNQVHDEIVLECSTKEDAEYYAPIIQDIMTEAGGIVVKHIIMKVDYDVDRVWKK